MFTNLLYLIAVHIWNVNLGPVLMDTIEFVPQHVPWPSALVLRLEQVYFGETYWLYHAVNLVLLYGCMLLTMVLVRTSLQSVWWLGSLASVLMMANPIKDHGVTLLTASTVLIPVLLGLLTLVLYAKHCEHGEMSTYIFALSLAWFLQFTYPSLLPLALVIVLYEGIVNPPERQYWIRVIPFVLIGVVAIQHWGTTLYSGGWSGVLFSLVRVLYPVDYLPETVVALEENGLFRGAMVLLWLVVVGGIGLKLRSRGYWFGVSAGIAWMALLPGYDHRLAPFTDLHMFMPIIFINLALAALCSRIQSHPRWNRLVVVLTLFMCIGFFVLSWMSIAEWHELAERRALVEELDMGQFFMQ